MKANEIVGYILLAAFVIAVVCIPLLWAADRSVEMIQSRRRAARIRRQRREPGTTPRGPYRRVPVPGDDAIPGGTCADPLVAMRFAEICRSMPDLGALTASYRAPDDRWAEVINPDGES